MTMTMTELPLLDSNPKCIGCGACCMMMTVPPDCGEPEDDAWWESLPESLQEEIGAVEGYGQPCIWLDIETRRCKHYEHRPPTCRKFNPGNAVCEEDRLREGINK